MTSAVDADVTSSCFGFKRRRNERHAAGTRADGRGRDGCRLWGCRADAPVVHTRAAAAAAGEGCPATATAPAHGGRHADGAAPGARAHADTAPRRCARGRGPRPRRPCTRDRRGSRTAPAVSRALCLVRGDAAQRLFRHPVCACARSLSFPMLAITHTHPLCRTVDDAPTNAPFEGPTTTTTTTTTARPLKVCHRKTQKLTRHETMHVHSHGSGNALQLPRANLCRSLPSPQQRQHHQQAQRDRSQWHQNRKREDVGVVEGGAKGEHGKRGGRDYLAGPQSWSMMRWSGASSEEGMRLNSRTKKTKCLSDVLRCASRPSSSTWCMWL